MVRKIRSPNYPRISLREAIEQVTRVYEEEGTHSASDGDIVKDLGYKSLNGTSSGVLSALKKYGLLQRDEGGFKVTSDAVAIIELPPGSSEHSAAVRKSAFRPVLFAEMYEKYGPDLPNDRTLRHFLITKNFNPKTTNEVICVYRDTLEFVSEDLAAYPKVEEKNQPKVEVPPQPALEQPKQKVRMPGPRLVDPDKVRDSTTDLRATPTTVTILQFKTSEISEARLELTGNVTQDSIDALISILNVQKLVFSKGNEPE